MSVNAKPGTSRHAVGSKMSETTAPCWCLAEFLATTPPTTPDRRREAEHVSARLAAMTALQIFGLAGLPEIEPGHDIAALALQAAADCDTPLQSGDVLVVTSKIVSKAEGRIVELDSVEPSPFALSWSQQWDKDPAVTEIVLRESKRIVRQLGPVLITETHHGFVCANSGVDQSSSGGHGRALLLPLDSDASARAIRSVLVAAGLDIAVIVSDTFGRAWREGQTDIAIGIA